MPKSFSAPLGVRARTSLRGAPGAGRRSKNSWCTLSPTRSRWPRPSRIWAAGLTSMMAPSRSVVSRPLEIECTMMPCSTWRFSSSKLLSFNCDFGLAHAAGQFVGQVGDGGEGEQVDRDDGLQRFQIGPAGGIGVDQIEVGELQGCRRSSTKEMAGGEVGPGFRQQGGGDDDDERIEEIEARCRCRR